MALRFDVLTLFPELFAPFLHAGITRRAWADGQMRLKLWNPRDWAEGRYRRVDDRPLGGGPGMVMLAEPLARCLAAAQADRLASGPQSGQPHEAGQGAEQESAPVPVVLFSPTGPRLNHAAVQSWAASRGAILICGRYEGIDQRFIDRHVTHQISLGDFVLSGGEIATSSTASTPRWTACSTARTTPAPKCGKAKARLPSCSAATTPALSNGAAPRACNSPPASAPTCWPPPAPQAA